MHVALEGLTAWYGIEYHAQLFHQDLVECTNHLDCNHSVLSLFVLLKQSRKRVRLYLQCAAILTSAWQVIRESARALVTAQCCTLLIADLTLQHASSPYRFWRTLDISSCAHIDLQHTAQLQKNRQLFWWQKKIDSITRHAPSPLCKNDVDSNLTSHLWISHSRALMTEISILQLRCIVRISRENLQAFIYIVIGSFSSDCAMIKTAG